MVNASKSRPLDARNLFRAIHTGDFDRFKELLDGGVHPNVIDNSNLGVGRDYAFGRTGLHWEVLYGNSRMVRYHLERVMKESLRKYKNDSGAAEKELAKFINTRDSEGYRAIDIAIEMISFGEGGAETRKKTEREADYEYIAELLESCGALRNPEKERERRGKKGGNHSNIQALLRRERGKG